MTNFLIDPTSYQLAKALDFWLGLTGFGITIATFVLGKRKLRAVQQSANDARDAADDARFRVRRYDAASELSQAIDQLGSLYSSAETNNWRVVVEIGSSIRHALNRNTVILEASDTKLASSMRQAAKKLQKVISDIDLANGGRSAYPDQVELTQLIRRLEDTLKETHSHLQERIP